MIVLSNDTWHVKIYKFLHDASARCWSRYPWMYEGEYSGVTLCQYLRVLFITGPLAILLNVGVWLFGLYALIISPIMLVGFVNYLINLTGLVLILALLAAVVYVVSVAVNQKSTQPKRIIETHEPSLFQLIRKQMVDTHERVCVLVKFKD